MNKNHIIGKVFLSMLLLTTSSFSKIFTVSNVAEFRKASQVVYGVGEEVEYKKKGTESTLKVGDVEEDSKRKLKEVSYEERIMKLARKLNIQTENKSLNEIIDEIEAKLSRKEKVGESK